MAAPEADFDKTFESRKIYLLSGDELNCLYKLLRQNRPRAKGAITVDARPEGSFIGGGGGAAATPNEYLLIRVNGSVAYLPILGAAPLSALPDGVTVVNPEPTY